MSCCLPPHWPSALLRVGRYYRAQSMDVPDRERFFPIVYTNTSLTASEPNELERIPVMWKRSLHVGSNWHILAD